MIMYSQPQSQLQYLDCTVISAQNYIKAFLKKTKQKKMSHLNVIYAYSDGSLGALTA